MTAEKEEEWSVNIQNNFCPFRRLYDKDAWSSNWSSYVGCTINGKIECNFNNCTIKSQA
jgi:hypothetical protein